MSGYTQEQVNSLRAMLATGVLKGTLNGEQVEFRSLADMQALLASMERSVAGAAGAGRVTHIQPRFDRGC
jgi:hypothetical protein